MRASRAEIGYLGAGGGGAGEDGVVGGLQGEARDRVRAMGLWLVTALVLGGVLVALFAMFVGFAHVRPTAIHAVVPGADDRVLTIHYSAGSPGCDRLHRVDVVETDEVVELQVDLVTRIPMTGRDCLAVDEEAQLDVVLEAPLAERTVRDGPRQVPVREEPAERLSDG